MYVCGITVYDYCHIGHARMLVAFDVIARWLRASGYDLNYVRNITDIDDKILRRAGELQQAHSELTSRFIDLMHEDERALGIAPPDVEPRATGHIEGMVKMIAQLIDSGAAYAVENGDVYYSVASFDGYGKLSGKNPEELLDGARVEVGELKRDPRDFALWKGAVPSEPADAHWDAPWGKGRPGWHIECSVMSTASLGNSFDIHGGGVDLVFPHHENEIAQAESATGCHYAKYWLHNNAVRVNHEKMSKSLGNFFTIRDTLKQYSGETIRYFLLSSHYRSPINYSEESLGNARAALERFYLALDGVASDGVAQQSAHYESAHKQFSAAMDDDFGTPEALAVLFDLVRKLNIAKAEASDDAPHLAAGLRALGAMLGILQDEPAAALRSAPVTADGLADDEIDSLVQARTDAKLNKDYALADKIRVDLADNGVILEDSREGTRWRRT